MGAVGMLAGREIRRRWLRLVALTLLVGVVGAVVLSTAAGARRSDTALARFNAWSRSSDVQLAVAGLTPPSAAQVRALSEVDGVVAVASARQFGFVIPRAPNLGGAAAADTRLGTVVDRARIVAGRAANPSKVNEINIGEGLAAELHLGVGSRLDVATYSSAEVHAAFTSTGNLPASPAGPRLRLRIVGIERRPLDLGNNGAAGGIVIETPAFNRYYASRIGSFGTVLRVRTRQGATDVPQVVAAAKRIFAHAPQVKVTALAVVNNSAQDAINVLSVALWIFAGVVALAGGVAIAIILTREISLASVDQATLRALGLSRRQRAAINGYPALLIAGGGALISVVGAIAASPLFPFGVARRADPHLGVHVDWVVLAAGVVAVALFIGSIAFVAALRSTRGSSLDLDASTPQRPSRIVERAARAGLAPSTSAGLRMALEPGRGRTAVPVRSAYLGAVFGIAGLIAVFMFASSVQHLAATPRLYGWTADFAATDQNFGNEPGNYCGRIDYGLSHTAGIAAVASVCTQTVQLDGDPVTGYGFTSLRGTIAPEIAHGHAPRTAQEIALGSVTLHALNKHLGDTVHASGPTHTHSYRIVGQVVLPGFAPKQAIADGATFTDPGIQRIFDDNNTNRYFLIRFAPGANRAALEQRIATKPQLASPTRPAVPPEVDRLRQINWFPATLAALLAALALLAVGHALVTSVRRRRCDLALFKTLGFSRRQVRATIVWQATTIATVGLIMGIPAGLALGTLIWQPVANSVGVSTTAAFPALALVATIPAVLALVNLLAYFPARAAAQIRPAIALRTE